MITGTGDFQPLFQELLSENSIVDGHNYRLPIVKLSDDSTSSQSTSYITSGSVYVSGGMLDMVDDVHLAMHQTTGTLGGLDQTVVLSTHDCSVGTLVFEVQGTWKGKVVVEGSVDGTYNNLSIVQPGGVISFAGVNNDNQNGVYRALLIAAYTHVRLRMSSYTSGVAGVIINAAQVVPTPYVWQLNPSNLNATVYQGALWSGSVTNFPTLQGISGSVAVSGVGGYVIITGSTQTTFTDDFYHDSFGRLRVSDSQTRFDVEFSNDDQPIIMDKVTVGGASIVYNSGTRDVSLSIVSNTGTASSTFASHFHVPYTPGNSQLIDITGTMDYAGINSGTVSIILMNAGSETAYQQANWRYASNASTIDWTKSQIMAIDFQSLKVGRLRVGFVRNGNPSLAHVIENDNIRANGYWQRPNLPVFWKIYNSGTSTISEMGYGDENNGIFLRHTQPINANAKSLAICATVKSEGGLSIYDMPGFPFAFGNGATTRTASTTKVPICSIQVQTLFKGIRNRTLVVPTGLSFLTDNPIFYEVVLNPSLSGSVFNIVNTESSVYGDVAATSYSGGTVIYADYVGGSAARSNSQNSGFTGRIPLSINYRATVGDILTVSVVRVGTNNAAVGASIQYKEIR